MPIDPGTLDREPRKVSVPENRVAIVSLPQDFLIRVLNGEFELCGWPDDAEVVGVYASWQNRVIDIMFASKTLDPVPQGDVPPNLGRFIWETARVERVPILDGEGNEYAARCFYVSERAERIETPDGKVKFREFL